MQRFLRDFLASDLFVGFAAIIATACFLICWRIWRDPDSWHLDGETKQLVFHAWPPIMMAAAIGFALATLTLLTI